MRTILFRHRVGRAVPAAVLALATLAGAWNPSYGGVAAAAATPPAPTPEEIKARIAAAGDKEKYDGADWVVVLDESNVRVRPSGLATTTQRVVSKVLTDAGVKGLAVRRFDFDPHTNLIDILEARIHRADGRTEEVDVSQAVVKPAPAWLVFWGGQQKVLGLPRLAVGDAVEIVTAKTGFNVAYLEGEEGISAAAQALQPPMPGHWYDIVYFDADKPCVEKRYTVRTPKDKLIQYEIYNGGELTSSLKFDGDHLVYSWERKNAPAFAREPMMVSFDDAACKLVLATVPDWETKSRWFFQANEQQFEVDDEIQGLVDRTVAANPDQESQFRALNHWVAENIRYVGSSRGPCEGYTVHEAVETFRDRGGVCKDKAGMLVALLRAAGYESYLTMTMAGSRVEEIPADQFNHAVVTVVQKDGSLRLLDPTWSPKSRETWSSREQLQNIVRGTPQGRPLEITAYSPPERNVLICRSQSQIESNGTLRSHVSLDMDGYPDTYVRRWLDRHPPRERVGAFTAAMQRLAAGIRLADVSFTDPLDFSRPAELDMVLTADRYVVGDDRVRLLRLPLMAHPLADIVASDILDEQATKLDERKQTLRMRCTRLLHYEESISLPQGWRVTNLPEPQELDGPAAALKLRITASENRIDYGFELALKKHQVPPEDYKQFKEAVQAMRKVTDHWIVCDAGEAQTTVAAQPAAVGAAGGDGAK